MFFTFMLERSAAQPVVAQVLYAGGEREGGGLDGGRGRVPQAQTPKGLLSGVRLGDHSRVTHIYNCSLYIFAPNPYLYLTTRNHHHRPIFDWWGNISHHNLDLYSFSFDFDSLSSRVRPVHILILLFLRWPLLQTRVDPPQKPPFTINLLTLYIRFCTRKTT